MEWDILKSFCFNSQKIIIPLYHIESFSIATSKYCCEQKEHSSKSQEKRVWFTDSPPNQPGDLSPLIFPPRASVSNVSGERPGLCDLFRFPRPLPTTTIPLLCLGDSGPWWIFLWTWRSQRRVTAPILITLEIREGMGLGLPFPWKMCVALF